MKQSPDFLNLIGRMWSVFNIEGTTPDVGKRRENFVRIALEKELGFKLQRPETELQRQIDFFIIEKNVKSPYSFKSTTSHTIKVAWDGNVTEDRLRHFSFKNPILLLYKSKDEKRLSGFYVFDVDDLNSVMQQMGKNFWPTINPLSNPRGFGPSGKALTRLLEIAVQKKNFVEVNFPRITVDEEKYWTEWYNFMKGVLLS
jgi:hypothetical protein